MPIADPYFEIGDRKFIVKVLLSKDEGRVIRQASIANDAYSVRVSQLDSSNVLTEDDINELVARLEEMEAAVEPSMIQALSVLLVNFQDYNFEALSFDSLQAVYHAASQTQQHALIDTVARATGHGPKGA